MVKIDSIIGKTPSESRDTLHRGCDDMELSHPGGRLENAQTDARNADWLQLRHGQKQFRSVRFR